MASWCPPFLPGAKRTALARTHPRRGPQCSASGGGDRRPQLAEPSLARAGAPRHAATEARDEPDAESQGLALLGAPGTQRQESPANPEMDALHLLPRA